MASTPKQVAFIKTPRGGVDIAQREDETITLRVWKQDAYGIITSPPPTILTVEELDDLIGQALLFLAGDIEVALSQLGEAEA